MAVTGPGDNRTLAIALREPMGGRDKETAFVSDYVRVGLDAPVDFEWPAHRATIAPSRVSYLVTLNVECKDADESLPTQTSKVSASCTQSLAAALQ